MQQYGLQIAIVALMFAIHYTVMSKLTPLTFRPQFKLYSIISHIFFLVVQILTWIFGFPTSFINIIPIGFYSLLFAPLAGVLLFFIFRFLNKPKVDLLPQWKYLMLICYGSVVIIALYFGYYLFAIIFY